MKNYPSLAGKRADLDGTSYFIHGLVHDNPLISISWEFKEKVNEMLKGSNVICEDGFIEYIKNAVSFDEAKYFGFDKISFSGYLASFKGLIYNKFILKSHKTEIMNQAREMKTLEDLESVRNELFKGYSSEPEGMNKLLMNHNCGALENPKNEIPLRIRRYIYEAKQSLDYAHKNKLNELHIVVGLAHELPLEYLLNNKEILDKYNF